jgi:hypothetical protein
VEAAVWRNEEAANEKKKKIFHFGKYASCSQPCCYFVYALLLRIIGRQQQKMLSDCQENYSAQKKMKKHFFCLPNKYAIEISPFQTFKILTRALQTWKDRRLLSKILCYFDEVIIVSPTSVSLEI